MTFSSRSRAAETNACKQRMLRSEGSVNKAKNYKGLGVSANRKQCVWDEGKTIDTGLIKVREN